MDNDRFFMSVALGEIATPRQLAEALELTAEMSGDELDRANFVNAVGRQEFGRRPQTEAEVDRVLARVRNLRAWAWVEIRRLHKEFADRLLAVLAKELANERGES